ncbi:MAG TPA: response regulator [Bryobacteraceae bacterium]|nr:response regulator [Bryobacteraceae bacterium]HOL71658.1 response regulator [Bryobacteraceae bacterium]
MAATVLCVDDDPLVLGVTRLALGRRGYHVLTATTGAEALSMLRQAGEEIALVLLDWRLEDLDGEDVLLSIKQISSRVKVLVTSGDGSPAALLTESGGPAAGFLEKPYSPAQLLRSVQRVLGQETQTAAA